MCVKGECDRGVVGRPSMLIVFRFSDLCVFFITDKSKTKGGGR